MNFSGLSLDQAPPFRALLNLFFTACFFGILFGAALLYLPSEELLNRFSYFFVGTLHLITVGFMLSVMFGALLQMLPVLAGVRYNGGGMISVALASSIIIGTLSLVYGFYIYSKTLLNIGMVFLVLSAFIFASASLYLLSKTKYFSYTIRAMKFSLFALLLSVLFAALLVLHHTYFGIGGDHYAIVALHLVLAFFGWVVMLIIGVAFQVVPMFYVASEFPLTFRRYGLSALYISIFIFLATIYLDVLSYLPQIVIASLVFYFSILAIKALRNRKRRSYEPTVIFWYVGLSSFALASILLALSVFLDIDPVFIGIFYLFGGALSIIHGMLYRIVPFLTWFHLSSQGIFDAPNMREILPFKKINIQMWLFFGAIVFMALGYFYHPLLKLSGLLFLLSFALLYS